MRLLYRCVVSLSLLSAPLIVQAQEPAPSPSNARVMLGDITDNRTTGQYFAGLKLELKLSGDGVYEAYGIGKPEFTVAKDDTGRSLLNKEGQQRESMLWDLQSRKQKSANETISGDLGNPSRKAATFTVQGTIPVYTPSLDPDAVVTIPDIHSIYGQALESKPTNISLTVMDKDAADVKNKALAEQQKAAAAGGTMGSALSHMMGGSLGANDLQFRVSDPNGYLVKLEVIGPDGKAMETGSRSKTGGSDGVDVYTNSYHSPIAKGTSLKIYYATKKSMNRVPFSFENVPLP